MKRIVSTTCVRIFERNNEGTIDKKHTVTRTLWVIWHLCVLKISLGEYHICSLAVGFGCIFRDFVRFPCPLFLFLTVHLLIF